MIWNLKYKAQTFDEIICNGEKVKSFVEDGDFGNLLLFGPAGQGKSLSAEVIVNTFNLDYIKLNASDERSIDVLRGKLKNFAMSASSNGKKKVIILDEIEAISKDAMDALRGFMDDYGKTNIFIGTTNYLYKVSEPIQSRFTRIEFSNIPIESIFDFLKNIVDIEKVDIDDDVLTEMIKRCKGDIRASINKLEELHRLGRKVVISDLKTTSDMIENIHSLLQQRKFPDARQLYLDSTIKANDFLNIYHEYLMDLTINKSVYTPDKIKVIIERFFEASSELKYSSNDDIVIDWLLLKLMELI